MSCTWTSLFGEDAQPLQVVNLGSLADNMVYLLPGCSDLMIRKTLQSVYREFCDTAASLRMKATFDIEDGVQEYTIRPIFSCIVDSVCKVWLGDKVLKPVRDFTLEDGDLIKVVLPLGRVSGIAGADVSTPPKLEVECVLVPTINSEECPAWFQQKYGPALVSGSLYRLFSMTNRPWSDPTQASREFNSYQNAVNRSRMAICSGDGSISGSGEVDCLNREGMI